MKSMKTKSQRHQTKHWNCCIVAQFSVTGIFGSMDELTLRHSVEDKLQQRLSESNVGVCDGGQSGCGSMEIFCYASDKSAGLRIVEDVLNEIGLELTTIASNSRFPDFSARLTDEGWETFRGKRFSVFPDGFNPAH